MQINPVSEEVEDVKITKLWENPNPTSAFAAQNITLASDDYVFLFTSYKVSTTGGFMSTIAPKGGSIYLDAASWQSGYTAATYDRTLNRVNDTQYTATDAELNGQVNNSLIIPYAIYGIK